MNAPRGFVVALTALWSTGCAATGDLPAESVVPERIESTAIPSPLPLKEAIRIAQVNDPSLRGKRHRVSEAYWRKVQASLLPNPTIGGSADPQEWIVNVLWWFDELARQPARVAVGKALEDQTILEVARRRIELARNVRIAFIEIAHAREIENLLKEKEHALTTIVGISRGQEEAGGIARIELASVENALVRVKARRSDIETTLAKLRGRLNRLLGTSIDGARETGFHPEQDLVISEPSKAREFSLVRRPEIALVAAKAREHQATLSLAALGWLPRAQAGPYLKREEGDLVGGGLFTISIPVFNTGGASTEAERAALRALQEDLQAAEAHVLLEIHESALEYARAKARATEDHPRIVANLESAIDVARQSTEIGGESRLGVLRLTLQALDAKLSLAESRRDYWTSIAQLLAASGDAGD